ncbi:MAG: hypothetical protein AAFQ62_04535 [Pseudomonadota bacterium]
MLRKRLLVFALLAYALPGVAAEPAAAAEEAATSNWTHTYLKAADGQADALRQFIEQNWFAMDAIAVEQGLFKSYVLIENLAEDTREWDFIVAVEYFGDQGYADIREPFERIRAAHETVLIDGKRLPELGRIVGSERVRYLRAEGD